MRKMGFTLLAIAVAALLGLFLLKGEVKIDSCLDNGGRWNYESEFCEYAKPDPSAASGD